MKQEEIKGLIRKLTLEEKAGLCSGNDNWFTKAVTRLGIPAMRMSDGPHGLRTQEGSVNTLAGGSSVAAVCFPAACCTAASFDRDLVKEMGAELGRESQALGVHVLLGPGINMKRSPLCGRNFEYFSEDPLVAGELGASFVNGLQSEGVGASLKHFFANSQEHRRMDSSSEMDERTMREIYLAAFEKIVKKAQPWTIMAAYNKINGVFATANKKYLKGLLRDEWGFEGAVISDWGATHDRVAAVEAGCNLTMPSATESDHEIVEAVQNGKLDEADLDHVCAQLLNIVFKAVEAHHEGLKFNYESGHVLAKKIASESIVLLKNEGGILPLKGGKIAFIGTFAQSPRYQGGGSSHINSSRVISALDAAKQMGLDVLYAPGYDEKHCATPELLAEAEETAKAADIVVVFAGLPDDMESEGVDRGHMQMPEGHNRLIEAVCKINPNTVVVLHNGAPVEMPWVDLPKGILECYLGGEAIGAAVVDVLFGKVTPSGHLPETFPKRLQDNPSYLFFRGEGDRVEYPEKFFMGYRYYVSKEVEPLFPFGHGLSYTDFTYANLILDRQEMDDTDSLRVSVRVTNSGAVSGKVLVQLYVAPPRETVIRPVRELKGFEKVLLAPGESRMINFDLSYRDFAHWSEDFHDWRVESGNYMIQICENAHSVILEQHVKVRATKDLRPIHYSLDMTMSDLAKSLVGRKVLDENIGYFIKGMAAAGYIPKEAVSAAEAMGGGAINFAAVEILAAKFDRSVAGGDAFNVFLNQPVSMLAGFLTLEKKRELKKLMEELNDSAKV